MSIVFLVQLALTLLLMLGVGWWLLTAYRERVNFRRSLDLVFLEVRIPKKDSKEDMDRERDQTSEIRKVVGVAEHFFQTLHGVYDDSWSAKIKGQDFLSFEILAIEGEILFIVGCGRTMQEVIKKQITSFYTEAIIEERETPHLFHQGTHQLGENLGLEKSFHYPLKNYQQFESTDPLNNILNTLSAASDENGNAAAVQIMIRPVANDWQDSLRQKSKELAEGKASYAWWNVVGKVGGLLVTLVNGETDKDDAGGNNNDTNTNSQEANKQMDEKGEKVGFETMVRLLVSAREPHTAKLQLQSLVNAFSQYGGPTINGLTKAKWLRKRKFLENFVLRAFSWGTWPWGGLTREKSIMTPTELASLFHFPHVKYNNIPGIKWQNYKIVQTPPNIPKDGLLLGHNIYRGVKTPVYMKREDRFRHFYVIGQTGTGKSSIFQAMIRQDLANGDGLCVIDPHGSLVEDLLPFVPKSRVDDVVIFNPADLERPMGLNLLEATTPEEQDVVALDAMNIMIKMFNEEVFGPRIQDYFRNGCLTLMADPEGGRLTDIVRLFTDDDFQKQKVKHVTNPIVKSFWENQMAKTGAREKAEMIPYFAAKFGAFITNGMMRNIIGQRSAFDISECMDNQKILFMNLSKGVTGEINSKLLGLIIVSKLQMAALRRQKQGKGARQDFFLYIDEFQNYVTDSIESILSEARKYRLSLNIAHQYIGQIDQGNQKGGVNLKDAVFGNVGTMMCYKISATDSEHMAKEMAPTFSDQDLVNIDKYKAVMKLSIDTQPSRPFSIIPTNPYLVQGNPKMADALKQISRLTYGRSKKFVEREIFTRLDI